MDFSVVDLSGDVGMDLVVPSSFFAYHAMDRAERVYSNSFGFVKFGTIGRAVGIFVSEETGHVVSGVTLDDTDFVNGSIGQFTSCVRELTDKFPYYSANSASGDWEQGAQVVEETVKGIDAMAYREGSFWYEFRWDVSMGEFHDS
ncbi:SUKH-4 family immunity protein [Streptomyces sp. NPDC059881]|uniref:SUKH-4 family immunity protein n=1 Tax=Streptomyces sp. NPDC059881 TaxID=3346986 RepID=UPI00365F5C0B